MIVETKYDLLGRVQMVTNPYRQGDTVYWSLTEYDELGRAKQTREPVANQDPASPTGNILGVTSYDLSTLAPYLGTVITTTDAAGKKGRSITNALGQLIVVEEPDSDGNLTALPQGTPLPTPTPTPGGGGYPPPECLIPDPNCGVANLAPGEYPSYATYYRYDTLGKMVEVTQGVQKRWFKYDSLGRLIRVRQPEQEVNTALNLADSFNTSGQWTAGFTYDVLGNVLTATDANGTTITNTYDRAGRVKIRSYSDSTPAVSFFYDGKGLAQQQSPNYAKGKLTKVTSSVSETQYKLFDNLGKLTEMAQITDGHTYTSKYTYNFAGALVEEEYPSGRKVKNEFESDGDLLKVTSQKNSSSVYTRYASNFSYTASGGISQMKLGNGRWETAKFNTRLQVTELGLGSSAANAGLWKTAYEYGELQSNGTVDATKNTGNIARQTLTVPGTSFVQSYEYDSLYRLKVATEKTGSTQNWTQSWNYDRYGNRVGFAQNVAGFTDAPNPAVDANTNRFSSGQGFTYDLNGNLVIDNEGRQFTFNGDNKQTVVRDAANNVIGQYFFDGEGKRVKKITNSETTVFVYSSGKLVAEYSNQVSQTPTVAYTTTDHLGSPRIITDQYGQVKSRRDFMPFGEDIYINVGARTSSLQYSSTTDDIKQKFTGYLKDNETGLDFAEARMYENRFGRFTAIDPLLASGKSSDPQTFNRYVYVLNNPLYFVDLDGEKPTWWRRREGNKWRYRLSEGSPGSGFKEYNGARRIVAEQHKWGRRWDLTSRGAIPVDDTSGDYSGRAAPRASKRSAGAINDALRRDLGARAPALQNIMLLLEALMVFPAAGVVGGPGAGAAVGPTTGKGLIIAGTTPGIIMLNPSTGCAGGSRGPCGERLPDELTNQLAAIYSKYPACSKNCVTAARDTLSAFQKAGIEGEVVQVSSGTPYMFTKDGTMIGDTGFHQVVRIGDRYFDAVTGTVGRTWKEYQELFEGTIYQEPVAPYYPPEDEDNF